MVTFFGRIRDSLSRTKQEIVSRFDEIVRQADEPASRSRPVDVDTVDALEELLISADIGVAATGRIIEAVTAKTTRSASLRDLVKDELRRVFAAVDRPVMVTARPEVILQRTAPWQNRPMLKTEKDPAAAVERLLAERAPRYALADCTVDASDLAVVEVVDLICERLPSLFRDWSTRSV